MAYEQLPGSTVQIASGGQYESVDSTDSSSYQNIAAQEAASAYVYATQAAASATAAAGSATSAASSATTATNAVSTIGSSVTAAAASATAAAASSTTANTRANAASASATAAETSATNAATSATTATTQATAASTSATNAATSATSAGNSATTATTQATNASNSASSAINSATSATNSAASASTSATNAGSSATAASTSATNAATSASNASASASSASTSATNAANSAASAAASATAATATLSSSLLKANNLSDVGNAVAARGNIGAIGASDNVTLTGKTISGLSNTFSNIPTASLADSSFTVNGVTGSLNNSITITAASPNNLNAGTGLSGGPYNGSSNVTLSLQEKGIAQTYGSASTTQVITTDAYGRIDSIVATPINITASQVSNLGTMGVQDQDDVSILGGAIRDTQVLLRSTNVANGNTISPDVTYSDIVQQINTQSAGVLSINFPAGNLFDGQKLIIKIKSVVPQTLAFNTAYIGSPNLTLPLTTSGSSKWDYLGFMYNSDSSKWHLLAKVLGI